MDSTTYIVLDTETGGVHAETDALLEIGALLLDSELKECESWSTTIVPAKDLLISSGALNVQNRNFQGLDGHELDEFTAIFKLNAWVKDNLNVEEYGKPIFVGFNCSFDLRFMSAAYERTGLVPCYCVPEHTGPIDVFKMAKKLLQKPRDVESHKLTCIADYYQAREDQAHTALADCRMTASVWRRLVEIERLTA